ncbi:MAG: GLPGLI family protein [Lentimicrobiaceae bacterium]|nr:GLPGLI family protein [Lentimicrobiaceae bacterium]
MGKNADFLKWIIGFFFLSCSVGAYPQFYDQNPAVLGKADLLVTYSMLWKEDTLNRDFQQQEDMLLLIGSNFSQFVSKNSFMTNLEGRKMEKEGRLQEFFSEVKPGHITRFTFRIYKDYENNKIIYWGHIVPTRFKYEEEMSDIKWNLGAGTSQVLGYVTNQAFTSYGGREWVVWYAPDLPINDGPYKFSGLPGLILKSYDTKGDYIFEAVSIEKLKEPTDIEMSERTAVTTTRRNFLKAEDNLRYDIINRAKEAGVGNELEQRMARRMLKRNNPIELE